MASLLRVFGNLVRLLFFPLWLYVRWSARAKSPWVVLRLQPSLTQFRARENLLRRLTARANERAASSLEELRTLVFELSRDPRAVGLLVYVPAIEAGWSACESVRDTLASLRDAGKQVVCYLPEGGANRELFVALAGSRIYMAPYSAFGPLGLASRPLYVRPLLDRIGVAVEAQSCGEYKSAAEPALRDTMSEPAREQLQALLSALHGALFTALCERRGLSETQVQQLFDTALLPAHEALAKGVIDGVVYESEIDQHLIADARSAAPNDPDKQPKPRPASAYVRMRAARLWRPVRRQACIAVVPLRGTIVGNQGGRWSVGIRPDPVTALLRSLADDAYVRAILLHIDSPGGSALASELLHHEIKRVAGKKPVIACFGEVAASGGYYLACGCNRIVAQPLAITGSIGVVSAKVTASALLDRLGVRPQFIRTAESADMLSFARGLTPREDALLREHANVLYERFLAVVAEGRHREVSEIEPLARGRVWTGRAAHERGLVDVLGSLDHALEEARAQVEGLTPAQRAALKPRVYTLKASPVQGLTGVHAAVLRALQTELPELALLDLGQRELASYYAPLLHEAVGVAPPFKAI